MQSRYGAIDGSGQRTGVYFDTFGCGYVNVSQLANYLGIHVEYYRIDDFRSSLLTQNTFDTLDRIAATIRANYEYLNDSGRQMLLDQYSGKTTLLGTLGQVGLSLLGLDLHNDIEYLLYTVEHWEEASTLDKLMSGIAFLPLIGGLKYSEEANSLLKNIDEMNPLTKNADEANILAKNADELAGGAGNADGIKNVYNSIKNAPKYPEDFVSVQNGLKKVNINDKQLLDDLRKIESGQWKKVYKDGYDSSGNKISIHYFESQSRKVFDVDVKQGCSN